MIFNPHTVGSLPSLRLSTV